MNGGKDVKIGHDKRPISVIPSDEQPLYNIANGELLTDEFGNQLVTKVDQFFLADASKDRATSVVFPENPEDKYNVKSFTEITTLTATYGIDLDVNVVINSSNKIDVIKRTGVVAVGATVKERSTGIGITFTDLNECEILTVATDVGAEKNNLYFSENDLSFIENIRIGDTVRGFNIPAGSTVLKKDYNRIKISKPVTAGLTNDKVTFFRSGTFSYTSDNVLKIAEVFRETSEVSSTLLGVDRAETQLSLFSNVSSYGLNNEEWEEFNYNTGATQKNWALRNNKIYGKRYLARIEEETQESAIKLAGFPPPYSFPFGPKFDKINLYNEDLYGQYINFINLGNQAYELFNTITNDAGQKLYPSAFINLFLNPKDVKVDDDGETIIYGKLSDLEGTEQQFDSAFGEIDKWTDTWRDIGVSAPDGSTGLNSVLNPVTGKYLSFAGLKDLFVNNGKPGGLDGDNTRPGYYSNYRRYSAIQSRRVFRYQPGRISGFTFGLRSSTEPVPGVALEWGIANPTDQYVFKIYGGQLSIVRRSTVPLSREVLIRNGLDPNETLTVNINGKTYSTVQPEIPSGDPFDVNDNQGPLTQLEIDSIGRTRLYHTIEIPRDKFNGDPLNGNGPSGYTIRPEKVTMWKIEFGWYGAIGARFYAYIPSGAGEARWVTIHTLVIENSLDGPCLRDSYFRFKYSLDVFNNASIKTPQFLYKYGASYYIDGGDEGSSEIYSVSTGLNPKQINTSNETSLFSIRPKDFITSSSGDQITNKKLILPTKFNISSNALAEVKVKVCRACPGFGHVFTPGVKTGENGKNMTIKFEGTNKITAVGVGASFTDADIGAKLIAPSIFNAYITDMDESGTVTTYPNGFKTYESAKVYGWGRSAETGDGLDGYPNYNKLAIGVGGRGIAGAENLVKDYAQSGITTTIQIDNQNSTPPIDGTYPHSVRLSNYNVHFASDFMLTGTQIKIQFMNPIPLDGSPANPSSHWADFMIGVTDKKPTISGNTLLGWDNLEVPWIDYSNLDGSAQNGIGNTSILPENFILFGESTHTWAGMDEDGVEFAESWAPTNFRCRMGEDVRIPDVTSSSGGVCSSVTITVSDEIDIATSVQQVSGNPDPEIDEPGTFLKVEGVFSGGITDWRGGQIATRDSDGNVNDEGSGKFKDIKPRSYTQGGSNFQYIEISGSSEADDLNNITLVGRSVTLKGNRLNETKVKLFNYDVYPLYLVGKLMDGAKIHNISITETTGEFQKTTAPIIGISNGGTIDLANDGSGNNTFNDSTPPTNFLPVERLSSATVDTQNQQIIRPSTTKDIFYIGENETREVDMTKVFGIDRNVVTPDNNNIEATFFTAKSLEGSSSKFVQSSLNFKEQ